MNDNRMMADSEYDFGLYEEDYGHGQVLFLRRMDRDGAIYRAKLIWEKQEDSVFSTADDALLVARVSKIGGRPISNLLVKCLQDAGELRRMQTVDNADLRGWLEDMRKLVFTKSAD